MSVFVTDAHSRATLQIVRSLGSRKINVYSGEKFSITPTKFSKYLVDYLVYPDPAKDPVKFVTELNRYCLEKGIKVILPVVDEALIAIAKYKDRIDSSIAVPIPSIKNIMTARDKWETIKLCNKLEIPTPNSILPDEFDSEAIRKKFELPLIIKPRISSGTRGIKVIQSWDELEPAFKAVEKSYGVPIIQEFIPHGGAYGVEVLYHRGKQLAKFSHLRLREYPEGGGPSTLRESVEKRDMEDYSKKLMDKLNWHGVAMVEFRLHKKNQKPYLMEINPRYWGSLRLPIVAGMDFPFYHYELALGKTADIPKSYKKGVKARWLLFGDIMWVLTSQDKYKFRKFFSSQNKGAYYDVLTKDDLLPSIGSVLEGIYIFLHKDMRKSAMDRGINH